MESFYRMSIVTSSKIQCLSQNVCVKYSTIGKSDPVGEIFDEFEFSGRRGRSFFDSDSTFFGFDGGSIGYVKQVGADWISNLIDFFNKSPTDEVGVNEKPRKLLNSPKEEVDENENQRTLRRKNNRRKRVRFRNVSEQTDEDNRDSFADSSEMSNPNWHERWANLNYYQPSRSLMEDQTSLQSTSDLDVYRHYDGGIHPESLDQQSFSDDKKVTIIKYVPVIPRELLPFWKKSFEREKLNDNDVLATLRQLENDISIEDSSKNVQRRFRPRNNNRAFRLRRRNNKRRRRNRNRIKSSNSRSDLQTSSSEVDFSNLERRDRRHRRRPSYKRPERRSSIPLIPIYVSLLPLFLILGFLLGAAISLR